MKKICQVCIGTDAGDEPTCVRCGEASWTFVVTAEDAMTAPAAPPKGEKKPSGKAKRSAAADLGQPPAPSTPIASAPAEAARESAGEATPAERPDCLGCGAKLEGAPDQTHCEACEDAMTAPAAPPVAPGGAAQ